MAMSKFAAGLLAGALLAGGFAGLRAWQEARYGTGPVESAAPVAGPSREIAFVANAVGGTVTLIDIASAETLGEIDVLADGRRPGLLRDPLQFLAQGRVEAEGGLNYAQDSDLSRDGRVLFVSRGHLGDVAAFDIASGAILWRTPVAGLRADHMAISPDGERLYVSTLIYSGDVVEVLDTRDGARIGRFTAGRWPHDVHVSPDGAQVYVASLGEMTAPLAGRGEQDHAYTVTLADAASLEVRERFAFEAGVRPFQVTADGNRLYAQLSNAHALIAYDLSTAEVTDRLELPVAAGVTEADWDFEAPHHGLALTPDEATLCVAARASDYAGLVSAPELSLIAAVPVGDGPSWSALSLDGGICVLANNRSDDVSLVSLAGRAEIARLPAGRGPKHVTVGRVPEDTLAAFGG